MKKKFTATAMALAITLSLGVGALAAGGSQTISALLNRDITITYNGQAQSFKDVNGNAVYPITYNGTTYLPVRGVSDLVGLPVQWDGATNTVRLGSEEKQPTSLVKQPNSGATERNWIISDSDQLKFSGDSGIQTYQSGVAYKIWNGGASTGSYNYMYIDTAGYSQLSFSFACEAKCIMQIFDQDGNVLSSYDHAGGIVTKTISLNGATKVVLAANGLSLWDYGVHTAFFFDPVLS